MVQHIESAELVAQSTPRSLGVPGAFVLVSRACN